ncbi:MAG: hypothetical protein EKK55_24355 [Rhodocyclaceae bacterium]|nr:MAG: hypothetical protein EKK55_24355 [Rhodocyclaceae bacterium]
MANGYDIDPTLPDPDATLPGDPITATEIARLCGALNCANAWVGAQPAFQQSWQHGRCSHTGPAPEDEGETPIPIATWRVHVPTTLHRTLVFWLRAEKVGAGDASVTLRSRLGDVETTVALDVDAADEWSGPHTLDLDVDPEEIESPNGLWWDDVELYINTASPTVATVYQIAAEIAALDSPLPAELVEDAAGLAAPPLPTGTTAAAGRPLHAARGAQITAAMGATWPRWSHRMAWSTLADDYPATEAADHGGRLYPPGAGIPDAGAGGFFARETFGVVGAVPVSTAFTGIGADALLIRVVSGRGVTAIAGPTESPGGPPPAEELATLVGTPTQGAVMRTWGVWTRLLIQCGVRRSAALHVGTDATIATSPLNAAESHRLLWRAGPRVGAVAVVMLVTATADSEGEAGSIAVELWTATGEIVDKGFVMRVARDVVEGVGFDAPWTARYLWSGPRVDRSAGVDATPPRALNAWGQSGEWLELRITTEHAIVYEAHAIEIPLPLPLEPDA